MLYAGFYLLHNSSIILDFSAALHLSYVYVCVYILHCRVCMYALGKLWHKMMMKDDYDDNMTLTCTLTYCSKFQHKEA